MRAFMMSVILLIVVFTLAIGAVMGGFVRWAHLQPEAALLATLAVAVSQVYMHSAAALRIVRRQRRHRQKLSMGYTVFYRPMRNVWSMGQRVWFCFRVRSLRTLSHCLTVSGLVVALANMNASLVTFWAGVGLMTASAGIDFYQLWSADIE